MSNSSSPPFVVSLRLERKLERKVFLGFGEVYLYFIKYTPNYVTIKRCIDVPPVKIELDIGFTN
jgi:hypothetical protein